MTAGIGRGQHALKKFHFPSDQMTLSISNDAGEGGGNGTCGRERGTINCAEALAGLNGQGHQIHLMCRGAVIFFSL